MGDILKEAIADAKAVRETALQNAKMALEEAFTPQLKNMLSAKLKEDEMGDEDELEVPVEDEEMGDEEVPAEGHYEDEMAGEEEPAMEDEMGDEEEPAMEDEMGDEEEPAMEDEMGDEEEPEEGMSYEDEEGGEEDKLDLEAIIRELEDEMEKEEEPVSEQDDAYDEKASASRDGLAEEDDAYDEKASASRDGLAEDEDNDDEDTVEEEYEIRLEGDDDDDDDDDDDKEVEESKLHAELKEYKEAVSFLKDKLHEVNILNAKLLFTNKLFKSYNLNNNQKLKVVETFDRAQTTREIKLVYSTLAEQFGDNGSITRKHSIKESASSAVGSTKPSKGSRKVISEETKVANRFKKLAGLIK